MDEIHSALHRMGLVRSADGRILGGVCAGLATKTGVDVWAVRALLVAAMIVLPGSPLILYPLMWVLMPDEDYRPEVAVEGTGRGSGAGSTFGDNPQRLPRVDDDPQDEIRR